MAFERSCEDKLAVTLQHTLDNYSGEENGFIEIVWDESILCPLTISMTQHTRQDHWQCSNPAYLAQWPGYFYYWAAYFNLSHMVAVNESNRNYLEVSVASMIYDTCPATIFNADDRAKGSMISSEVYGELFFYSF